MKLEFLSKSVDYIGGEPYQTRVVLGNQEGAVYPFFFPDDYINKDNGELFKLAMEKNYQENFPQRAENEKFAEYNEMIAKGNIAREKMEEESVKAQGTLMMVLEKLYEKGIFTDDDLLETTELTL